MIRLRRLFLKNISLAFLLSSLFSFNFLDKKISKKNSTLKKKKSNKYTWYLDINDK
jgi:hypothetical protein